MHMESVGKVLCQNVVLTWGVRLSAAYLGCEAQKRASEILRYKTTHNLTYAQAAKQVQGRRTGEIDSNQSYTGRDHGGGSCSHKCPVGSDTLIVNKVNFVAFVAEVINCAA